MGCNGVDARDEHGLLLYINQFDDGGTSLNHAIKTSRLITIIRLL